LEAPSNYRSLLQKSPAKETVFCKRDIAETFIWGGYDLEAPSNYRSLLQKSPAKETVFCKRDIAETFIWGGYDLEAPSNYRSLLQKRPIKRTIFCKKRPIILRSLLIVATPYDFLLHTLPAVMSRTLLHTQSTLRTVE
jgi:hypothetical protein